MDSGDDKTARTHTIMDSGDDKTAKTHAIMHSGDNKTAKTHAIMDSGDDKTAMTHAIISFVCMGLGGLVVLAGAAIIIESIITAVSFVSNDSVYYGLSY